MKKDITGLKFGKLTVIKYMGLDKFMKAQWYCECECGGSIITNTSRLTGGRTTSCGCLKGNRGQQIVKIHEGDKYGKLTVIRQTKSDKFGNAKWLCECECGNQIEVIAHNLRKGIVKSCGCLNRITEEERRLGGVLKGMKQRCENPKCKMYPWYGGRGIKVCEDWQDIKVFREWALRNGYRIGLTIDRIDVNGNYEPSNCRWISQAEQMNNTRSNIWLEYNGELHNITQWAEIIGMKPKTLQARITNLGWSVERALTEPVH